MRCFIEVDLVQAEWVVTAYIANDARMLEVVRSRTDPHIRTGSLISGAPEEFVRLEHEAVGHLTDPMLIAQERAAAFPNGWQGYKLSDFFLPRTMSIRQAGKKSNHGLNYGMEYRRFALENEMQESDAQHIVAVYRKVAYPGLTLYYRAVEMELRSNGRRLTNCFGQSRRFLDRMGVDLLLAAYAFKPQSTVANVATNGWRDTYNDREPCMKRVNLAGQVHDSIKTDNEFDSFDELHTQVSRTRDHMTTVCEYNGNQFILGTEVKIGSNWGDMTTVRELTPDGLEAALVQAAA